MKVRIGFGLGTHTSANDAGSFGALVDALEDLRFDSLWLSERLTGDAPDPLVALAFAAGRTAQAQARHQRAGAARAATRWCWPRRWPSLDRLSDGRFLPAVGLGAPTPVEHQAFGVDRKERAAWFDEALGLMRRLWTEDHVTHQGERFHIEDVTLRPKPVQQPIDVWLGGQAPSELRRVGRLGDGWLPSFCTVDDVAAGLGGGHRHRRRARPRRSTPSTSACWSPTPYRRCPTGCAALLAPRRPDLDPADVIPIGLDALREPGSRRFIASARRSSWSSRSRSPTTGPPSWRAIADAALRPPELSRPAGSRLARRQRSGKQAAISVRWCVEGVERRRRRDLAEADHHHVAGGEADRPAGPRSRGRRTASRSWSQRPPLGAVEDLVVPRAAAAGPVDPALGHERGRRPTCRRGGPAGRTGTSPAGWRSTYDEPMKVPASSNSAAADRMPIGSKIRSCRKRSMPAWSRPSTRCRLAAMMLVVPDE